MRIRHFFNIGWFLCVILACTGWAAGPNLQWLEANQKDALGSSSWIWDSQPNFLCHFRFDFELTAAPKEAAVLITADNGYELYVNGAFAGSDIGAESAVWQSVEVYNVATLLKAGPNVLAVRATDLGGQKGLLGALIYQDQSGATHTLGTDRTWHVTASNDPTGFAQLDYKPGPEWHASRALGKNGIPPWGKVSYPGPVSPHLRGGAGAGFKEATPDFTFPEAVLFLRGEGPESSTPGSPQAVWRIGASRAYFELDTLGPSMPGRSLHLIQRFPAGGTEKAVYKERAVFNAGRGLIGPPAVSHDAKTIYFSFAPEGEKFWRIYKISTQACVSPEGAIRPEPLTSGPFHDFDPEPLPDGRIVFSSTRIGNREEYHGNLARSLFMMNADGSGIYPITHHIVGDMEPRLTASGHIAFVRQDNFMERAKVETHIHSIRPDGGAGQVLLGADRDALEYHTAYAAEENGLWLRNFGFGSPAALPDGRVAAISSLGLVISGNEVKPQLTLRPATELIDISPLPDGRLLCALAGRSGVGVLNIESNEIVRIYHQPPFNLHSPVLLAPKLAPPVARSALHQNPAGNSMETGFLLGQNVFISRQKNADLTRIKAVRVIEGRPFATRSARHPYDHLGVESIELGTAPVAPDGSFYIEVPADRALTLQAVDAAGRSVVNELSWIYVRPGEQRSCVGCHSQREAAPPNQSGLLALRSPPVKLLGEGRPHRWRGNNAANGGVLNLQFDRMREAASIDLHTSGERPGSAKNRQELVEQLVRQLGHADPSLRLSAAQRLGILREVSAAPALERALRDESSEVRVSAALALAARGRGKSIPPLIEQLSDSFPPAAQAAHVALIAISGRAVSFNAYGLAGEKKEGIDAWKRLPGIQEIRDSLRKQLTSGAAASEELFDALAQVGCQPEAAAIRAWLERDSGKNLRVTLSAIRALGQLKDHQAVQLFAQMLFKQIERQTNAPAGDHEFGWTQVAAQKAGAAAEALGRIGTAEAESALVRAFERLSEFWYYTFQTADHDWLMGCHSSIPHFRILEALDAMGAGTAGPIVPHILRSIPIDTDRGLLFEVDAYETVAARLIARAGLSGQIVDECLAFLAAGSPINPTIHESTLNLQSSHLKPSIILKNALTNSPPAVSVGPLDPPARAAQLISILCDRAESAPRIAAAFNQFRAQPPSRARSWTCFYLARALGKLGDARGVEALLAALAADAKEESFGLLAPPNVFVYEAMTPFYRAAAARSLGLIGDRRATGALIQTVGDWGNALDVRHAAAEALVDLRDRSRLEELARLAATYPEVSVQRLLKEACEAASQPQGAARELAKDF